MTDFATRPEMINNLIADALAAAPVAPDTLPNALLATVLRAAAERASLEELASADLRALHAIHMGDDPRQCVALRAGDRVLVRAPRSVYHDRVGFVIAPRRPDGDATHVGFNTSAPDDPTDTTTFKRSELLWLRRDAVSAYFAARLHLDAGSTVLAHQQLSSTEPPP